MSHTSGAGMSGAPTRRKENLMREQPVAFDQAKVFWQLAAQTAAFAGNRHRAYDSLKQQFVATFPETQPVDYDAAMARLARLCRI